MHSQPLCAHHYEYFFSKNNTSVLPFSGGVLSVGAVTAQENRNIVGRLVDAANDKALAYATVVALNDEGRQAATAITYPDGRFSISLPRKGDYQLWFTFVGYQSLSKRITFDNSGQDLGKIALKAGVEVQSVEIKARQLVRAKRTGSSMTWPRTPMLNVCG